MSKYALLLWTLTSLSVAFSTDARPGVLMGNPGNYLELLRRLGPGDTLLLEPGYYDDPSDVPGLPIFNLNGTPERPIVIAGSDPLAPPVFLGRATHNTVRFENASYVVIRGIEIDGRNLGGDGVTAQGMSHHITLENILIRGVGGNQFMVGIATRAIAWYWIIRNVTILEAGTGIYLGNPDGNAPFINGVIEYNLIMNTIGYNMQIKHQNERPKEAGIPKSGRTIIRHNVFSKAQNGSTGDFARPNLLVGHWPLEGTGSDDAYEIYGNFFYQNPTGEPLFQGEGNVALYDNLFVNNDGDAIWIQPHNDVPRMIRIFNNTVVCSGIGIRVIGGHPDYEQKVIGNAVFADTPIVANDQRENITDSFTKADNYLVNAYGEPGQLDLYPLEGQLQGTPLDTSPYNFFLDWDRDFNGKTHDGTFRGAYAGTGRNPGWLPKLEIKPAISSDVIRPGSVSDLRIVDVTDTTITLRWTAPADDGDSGGPVSSYDLRYSNRPPEADITNWFEVATKVSNLPTPQPPGSQETVTVHGLAMETQYVFILRSIDDYGNVSDFSNVAIEKTLHVELTRFTAEVEGMSVRLTWLARAGGGHLDFEIQRRKDHEGTWEKIAFIKRSQTGASNVYSYVDIAATPGKYAYRLRMVDSDGLATFSSVLWIEVSLPSGFVLQQNFPNPFNPYTTIRYGVPGANVAGSIHVRLRIYNLQGHKVRTLVNERLGPGYYEANWDGHDDLGRALPSGIYICRLEAGGFVGSRRMVLAR